MITTSLLLQGALFFAVLDLILVPLLLWLIKPQSFRQFKWELLAVTALFWGALWFWVLGSFWETVYCYVFPQWARWPMPFFQAALTSAVAALAWRLAVRWRPHPLLLYLLFGGLWGLLSHTFALASGIVTRPPPLQGAAPLSALTIAFFEFIFYWCIISGIAAAVHALRCWVQHRRRRAGMIGLERGSQP